MTFEELLKTKGLSRREIEVAHEISKGITNKEAANALFVCEKTVKYHLTNIYSKLSVKSRAKLIFLISKMKTETSAPLESGPEMPASDGVATRLHPGAGNA